MTAAVQARPCDPDTLGDPCRDCDRRMHRGHQARRCTDGHPAHDGHGRCVACSRRQHRLCNPTRTTWRRGDLLDEWAALRGTVGFRDFPARVGLTYTAWERQFLRAQAAGDPRAVRPAPRTPAVATWAGTPMFLRRDREHRAHRTRETA